MRSGKHPLLEHPAVRDPSACAPGTRALVVFEDRSELSVLRLLRPGFRHCFCVIRSDLAWIACDPLKTRIEIVPLPGLAELELAGHYHRTGRTVLAGTAPASGPSRRTRLRPMSCVEVVKRILNIEAPWAFTPAQLYRALITGNRRTMPFRPIAAWPAVKDRLDIDLS
jgi:hypothetical protein